MVKKKNKPSTKSDNSIGRINFDLYIESATKAIAVGTNIRMLLHLNRSNDRKRTSS
jgi:hypothetical protein